MLGNSIHNLHTKIVEIVDSEGRSRQKDFTGRLQRELGYAQYINPIAVLCLQVYQLDIPLLQTAKVQELTSTSEVALLDRDYKSAIFGGRISKALFDAFTKSFFDALIEKYCRKVT